MTLKFSVYGIAQPKGSTRSFTYRVKQQNGRPALDRFGDPVFRAATTSDNPQNKDWQALVAVAARQAILSLPVKQRGLELGPVYLTINCYLPRPQKFTKKKYDNHRSPPHITKPDTSKLARSVEDALTGIAYRDDSQITDLVVRKRYVTMTAGRTDIPHIDVWVEEADPLDLTVSMKTAKSPAARLFPPSP